MCRLSWFLDPGGWSKTALVGLYFIFPGICSLSLVVSMGSSTNAHSEQIPMSPPGIAMCIYALPEGTCSLTPAAKVPGRSPLCSVSVAGMLADLIGLLLSSFSQHTAKATVFVCTQSRGDS
ncbi:hypothetical protein STEG23_005668, partial [Scotinomys teguina]